MRAFLIGLFVFLFLFLAPSTFYTISESEQGVVLQFERPVRVIVNRVSDEEFEKIREEISGMGGKRVRVSRGAGLYMKVPFLQGVRRFDARLLTFDEEPSDVVTLEKIKPRIDSYARWRVRNPLLFYLSIQREDLAHGRLRDLIRSALRNEIGRHPFNELIRSTTREIVYSAAEFEDAEEMQTYHPPVRLGREAMMAKITEMCDQKAREYGIQILDVRVKRADLPPENASSVFERMKAERQRIATRFEEEGKREATKIRAETDRKVKVILAEAQKTDLEIRGRADAQAADIYANGFLEKLPTGEARQINGFNSDPDFFHFTRRLEALRASISSEDRLILSTDSPLFQILSGADALSPARKP
ncbi:MAG: protease modulator HflC [Candidatus Omnitrophica bacterium]|nr:Modulator of FtsH protease HflC [bacterium]NUN96135.1 protease modulator HflC [Candidatus Omnitrophota bacterium]